jgi:hypothetical protein
MTDENVVPIPSLLDRLAKKLKGYLTQDAANRLEWIAIQEGICQTLVEARNQFTANIEFSRWLDANGFDVVNENTRAAAIAMGREPEALRKCLKETERKSLHTIYKFDFPRVGNVSKTTEQPKSRRNKRSAPQRDKVQATIRSLVEDGDSVGVDKLSDQLGVSQIVIRETKKYEQGRLEGLREAAEAAPPIEPLDSAKMAPTMQQRYEATLRGAKKQIREELIAEVRAEVDKEYEVYLSHWKERVGRADRISESYKGVVSRRDFRIILAALHPDANQSPHARAAFEIVKKLESVLVKPDEPAFPGPPLPSSVAEMMARRRSRR